MHQVCYKDFFVVIIFLLKNKKSFEVVLVVLLVHNGYHNNIYLTEAITQMNEIQVEGLELHGVRMHDLTVSGWTGKNTTPVQTGREKRVCVRV